MTSSVRPPALLIRRRRLVAAAALALAATAAVVALRPAGPRPCRETFEQVRVGMSYGEIGTTVGGPPGVYSGPPREDYAVFVTGGTHIEHLTWADADSVLYVALDTRCDRTCRVAVFDRPPDTRSLLKRIRDRLPW